MAISMDGRGRAIDNVFIERLWRSVKYENIYLMCYASPLALERGLTDYFEFYNYERPHQSLDYRTSWAVYQAVRGAGVEGKNVVSQRLRTCSRENATDGSEIDKTASLRSLKKPGKLG